MKIAWTTVPAPAPVSELTVGVTAVGVVYVSFGNGVSGVSGVSGLSAAAQRLGASLVVDPACTDQVARHLAEYLAGRRPATRLPVDWSLTSGVQHTVLATMYDTVRYGDTITYGELAVRSGAFGLNAGCATSGARAIGSMMGSNPIPVIVPCHRVLAADGLGGFSSGLEIKRWLLTLEGVLTPSLDFGMPASRPPH